MTMVAPHRSFEQVMSLLRPVYVTLESIVYYYFYSSALDHTCSRSSCGGLTNECHTTWCEDNSFMVIGKHSTTTQTCAHGGLSKPVFTFTFIDVVI